MRLNYDAISWRTSWTSRPSTAAAQPRHPRADFCSSSAIPHVRTCGPRLQLQLVCAQRQGACRPLCECRLQGNQHYGLPIGPDEEAACGNHIACMIPSRAIAMPSDATAAAAWRRRATLPSGSAPPHSPPTVSPACPALQGGTALIRLLGLRSVERAWDRLTCAGGGLLGLSRQAGAEC